MKFVFASDSFKGSLSSKQICTLLEEAAVRVFPSAECVSLSMADGGEGTLDALRAARTGECLSVRVHDGLMGPVRSTILTFGDEAFVEVASSCGLTHIADDERDPLLTTSFGVGESIGHALFHGFEHITVGLGGSCMNDGGMGCLRALGVRFFDEAGDELICNGKNMERVARIDESGLFPEAHQASFTLMSDVVNPLLGPNGATYTFGAQKGADAAGLDRLEAGMRQLAAVIREAHPDVDFETAGYGAAGGLGMALSVFLGAQMASGVETLLKWVDFDSLIADADLVITGEGQLDEQSLFGKAVCGVVSHAKRAGVPVAVVCGRSLLDDAQINRLGADYVVETSVGMSSEQAMARAQETYARAIEGFFASLV